VGIGVAGGRARETDFSPWAGSGVVDPQPETSTTMSSSKIVISQGWLITRCRDIDTGPLIAIAKFDA
jgi:hypothetical protein